MIARVAIVVVGLLAAVSARAEILSPEAARGGGVWLRAGAVRARGEAVCAWLQGMPFEPCFRVEKIDERSFRGSWMGFAYCDFTRRMNVAGMSPRRHSPAPLSLDAADADGPD